MLIGLPLALARNPLILYYRLVAFLRKNPDSDNRQQSTNKEMENSDQKNIKKLIALEIDKKIKERSFTGRVISEEEVIEKISELSGIPKDRVNGVFELIGNYAAELYNRDKEEYKEFLKAILKIDEIDIIEEDS